VGHRDRPTDDVVQRSHWRRYESIAVTWYEDVCVRSLRCVGQGNTPLYYCTTWPDSCDALLLHRSFKLVLAWSGKDRKMLKLWCMYSNFQNFNHFIRTHLSGRLIMFDWGIMWFGWSLSKAHQELTNFQHLSFPTLLVLDYLMISWLNARWCRPTLYSCIFWTFSVDAVHHVHLTSLHCVFQPFFLMSSSPVCFIFP